ncbi:uncharacterized protein FIBRA_07198 [Fibroporia radiculosa]|uniref:Uncharacterized protein n=1 Tax=Fibroporia radiculosa TaxID=599839 RepID=J4GUI0_9APHY|nr:uncharacterized protein FIBRA_07198 [Fibroporia radiculosa]CCM05000.1 predicted protein [Fibroporia radiculosa]
MSQQGQHFESIITARSPTARKAGSAAARSPPSWSLTAESSESRRAMAHRRVRN